MIMVMMKLLIADLAKTALISAISFMAFHRFQDACRAFAMQHYSKLGQSSL